MKLLARDYKLLLVTLFFIVFSRGILLEYTDLIDPTEARYASIAAEMITGNDWVTPKLPMPEGITPYLGKPPLHFWLTAISYKLFGIEEWTARLPSFLAAILILFCVYKFCCKFFTKEIGIVSGLIMFSSGMFFFIAGASVTDMTLTALVTVSILSLYQDLYAEEKKWIHWFLAAAMGAAAFLVKGPIAVVLIGLPFCLFSLYLRDFSWIRRMPWIKSITVFFVLIAPWFILCQIDNPDFLKYFIWNENIARYLFKEYGDKYGSGHTHFHGMSWLMLLAAFSPWTLFLFYSVFNKGIKNSLNWLREDQTRMFVFIWSISAALFFTFVRQLHAMYILPCIPGLAIIASSVCMSVSVENKIIKVVSDTFKIILTVIILFWIGIITAGIILEFNFGALIYGILLLIVGCYCSLKVVQDEKTKLNLISGVSILLVCTYLLVIVSLSSHLDQKRSTSEMLEEIANLTVDHKEIPTVGISMGNAYSAYWTARAWKNELARELIIEYVEPEELKSKKIAYLIFKGTPSPKYSSYIFEHFDLVKRNSKLALYKKKLE